MNYKIDPNPIQETEANMPPPAPLPLHCCMIRVTIHPSLPYIRVGGEPIINWLDPSGSHASEQLVQWFNEPATASLYLERINKFCTAFKKIIIDPNLSVTAYYTSGFEVYDKTGLVVKPHFHFAFPTRSPRESIRRQITRKFGVKGNAQYAICCEPIDTGDTRRLQYGCKQMPLIVHSSHPRLDELIRQAQSEYKAVLTAASARIQKKENNCLKDRLHADLKKYIDVHHFRSKNRSTDHIYKSLWKKAVLFYQAEKRDTSLYTLKDKILVFMVQEKLITMDDLFNRFHN